MSWSEAGPAITIRDTASGLTNPARFTSTCTLQMQDKSTMPYWLRMYGIKGEEFVDYAGGDPTHLLFVDKSYTHSDWTTRYNDASADTWQEYIESDRWDGPTRRLPKVFDIDKNRAHQVTQVPIPRRRINIAGFTWWRYHYNWGAFPNGWAQAAALGDVKVNYSDPHVLQLPDGSWLMVLARYVSMKSDTSLSPHQDNSLSDIVAWHSYTPDFEGDEVAGPFLIVESTRCWSDAIEARLWIGVPGAAVIQGDGGQDVLLVYYAVDTCGLGYSVSPGAPLGLEDAMSQADYESRLAASLFESGIALKRIQLDDLMARVDSERAIHGAARGLFPHTTESAWTPYQVDPSDAAVDGDLLGAPRFWVADGQNELGGYYVRAFKEVFSRENVQFRAPAPLVCGTDRDLSLYFAAVLIGAGDLPRRGTSSTVGSGHGIWRGRTSPTWLAHNSDTGSFELMEDGRDFIVAPPEGEDRRSVDMVAQSYTYLSEWGMDLGAIASPSTSSRTLPGPSYVLHLDPDPAQLEDGTFWVAAASPTLIAFTGSEEDGCSSADAIFERSEPAPDLDEDELAFLHRPRPETRILPSPPLR